MMQKFKFIRRSHGKAKATGKPYDMIEVSDGLTSFTLSAGQGVGQQIEDMELDKGAEFNAVVHVEKIFDGLRGTIVEVE
jgi:hypothetical protein